MEEQQNLSMKKMHQSKWKQVLFFVISMTALLLIYSLFMKQIEKRFEVKVDDFSWVYQIDSIENIDNSIVLTGFAFQLEQDAQEEMFELILCDIETGKGYYPKMEYSDREDVNEYFLCEYDYTKSGFTATLSSKKLDMENGVYEVLLRPVGERNAYGLGTYYANGEMYFTNPNEFEPLDVVGTDLEKIVDKGVLRVYRPDYGMYVYQYEGELYWIAEEWYEFNENKDTYVQFQMNTTQIQNLPQNRLENGWYWSNIGFMFSANELIEWNTGKYRVTKCAVPTEYSVTKIYTGNYMDEWIWRNDFRPWYEFGEE